MKLLSSSSSASSTISTTTTTTTYSFDGNLYTSRKVTAGCIAEVLRRLRCRNSLPTHPADHFREAGNESVEPQKINCTKVEDHIEALGTPSVVARLMGLESMPQIDLASAQKSPNYIARSRSMNSVESSKGFESIQGRHRRVKSFREIPSYRQLEDENFFILSFENGSKSRKIASKEKKSDKGCRQIEQRREEKRMFCGEMKCNKENKGRNKVNRRESVYEKNKENFCNINNNEKEKLGTVISLNSSQNVGYDDILKDTSNVLRPMKNDSRRNSAAGREVVKLSELVSHKENSEERSIKKKGKEDCLAVKTVEAEFDSQNSSPNSVLGFVEFPIDREAPISEEVSRLTNSKSRRTLWEELENYRKLNPCRDNSLDSNYRGPKASGANCVPLLSQKKDYEGHEHVQMWKEICKLADRETLQSTWGRKEISKLEDYEKMSINLELDILDQMVEELVDQLAGDFSVKL